MKTIDGYAHVRAHVFAPTFEIYKGPVYDPYCAHLKMFLATNDESAIIALLSTASKSYLNAFRELYDSLPPKVKAAYDMMAIIDT